MVRTRDEQPRITLLRRVIVLVLVVFVVSIGVPVWLRTTTIYRADLPSDTIAWRAAHLQQELHFRIPVVVEASPQTVREAQRLIDLQLQQSHPLLQGFWSLQLAPFSQEAETAAYVVKHNASQASRISTQPFGRQVSLQDVSEASVASALLEIFAHEIDAFDRLLGERAAHHDRVTIPYSSHYNLVFSLFSEGGHPIAWQIDAATAHLAPIFESLAHIANFSVSSQIQYYSKSTVQPRYDNDSKTYTIPQDSLSTFINFEDWNLVSHEMAPTINFVVYFPQSNYEGRKMVIEHAKSNSFMVPQWGGVYIFNKRMPPLKDAGHTTTLSESELLPVMENFTSQLFQIIGMPAAPAMPLLDIDTLARVTTYKNLRQALQNLVSLVKLTNSLSEISVPELTKTYVEQSLEFATSATAEVNGHGAFAQAAEDSARSVEYSDRAFFEKEMVQQAYFPQEHKLAVFLPLIGPISSILLLGVIKTLKDVKANPAKAKEE
ncbi:GPI transamidase component GPI17 [[Candida] zeylanoides]